jgi:NodT family efflux transporter outer membrane factor (OMF) lipoprotein
LPAAFALLDAERPRTGSIAGLLPRADPAFVALEQGALAEAPTLEAAIARIDQARAGLSRAGAERLPAINGSASGTGQRISSGQVGNLPPGVPIDRYRTQFGAEVGASWDPDLFGRLRASERAAAARLDAASADAAAVRVSLQADIAQAVIDARALAAREAVVRSDIADAELLVSVTRTRSRAGIVPGFDLVRAQALEAEARSQLAPIAGEQAQVLGRLVSLTARPAQEVRALFSSPAASPAKNAEPPLGIPSLLLRARPDVAAGERRLAAADQEIAAAAAQRYPRLTITSTLGLLSLGLGNLLSADSVAGSLSAGLTGPLLDFGRVAALIGQRQGEAREAFANYRRLLFSALGETEAALGGIAAADTRVAALRRQVVSDRDAVGLARERYRLGLDTFLTVIDAQRSANRSRSLLVEAEADTARSRVALYRAVGGEL